MIVVNSETINPIPKYTSGIDKTNNEGDITDSSY